MFVPAPSIAPFPQHITRLVVWMAQVKPSPAEIAVKVSPHPHATGIGQSEGSALVEPIPSWPCALPPQQNAARSVVMPQLWSAPALMAENRSPLNTSTG